MPSRPKDRELRDAFLARDPQQVERALAHGADSNLTLDGTPILVIACAVGDEQMADALLKAKADPNAADREGRTALMFVSWLGYSEAHGRLFNRLVSAGADPDAADRQGTRALNMAASFLNMSMVDRLLAIGVKPDKATQERIREARGSSWNRQT